MTGVQTCALPISWFTKVASRAVMCGSLNPLGGRAEPIPGGYRFSGHATNVTGSHHATWKPDGYAPSTNTARGPVAEGGRGNTG